MVYELHDTSKVERLFEGWNETPIYSCIQKIMGKIYVVNPENPISAFAFVGCFGFYAGKPDMELIKNKPAGFVIMVPQNRNWAELIERVYPDARKVTRYAIRKDTIFDSDALKNNLQLLPDGYILKNIDGKIYEKCLINPVTADFVSAFGSKEQYLKYGRGVVILKDGRIVSGASSYTRYKDGIELEVETVEPERRKKLAFISCSALILRCLEENLYPSWDAHDMNSVHLAEKFGYQFDHTYTAYEVAVSERTH